MPQWPSALTLTTSNYPESECFLYLMIRSAGPFDAEVNEEKKLFRAIGMDLIASYTIGSECVVNKGFCKNCMLQLKFNPIAKYF